MKTTTKTKAHWIRSVRKAAVPIVAVETADPAATMRGAVGALNGDADTTPIMSWDIVRALVGVNDRGREVAYEVAPDGPIQTGNPTECLSLLSKAGMEKGLVFFHMAHRFTSIESVAQAIWNLRDTFKARGNTLVLLCSTITLPEELKHDVVVVSEELPGGDEVRAIVTSIMADAGQASPEGEAMDKVADTLSGLSAFAAEQTLAMSVGRDGIDMDGLWDRKRKMIEQTPGLSVWRGGETFADIGGCENVKGFLRKLIAGQSAPRAIVYLDEIEKMLGGSGTDTSGVSQDQLRGLLTFMQDKDATGMIFVGAPGVAKSAVAKAAGNDGGMPTIAMDLGGMKGSLVGQSEARLRAALQIVDAVSGGKTLFIATCNSLAVLPPELKRRFTLGIFFFDLPSAEERAQIWAVWKDKFGIVDQDNGAAVPVNDCDWTGAEIRQCCNIAWRLGIPISEASQFIVPVAKASADKIEALRQQASGKFINAGAPGVYRYAPGSSDTLPMLGRKMAKL